MLLLEDRTKINGGTCTPRLPEHVVAAISADDACPLCWHDWNSVKLWTQFFRDFGITHVCDLTPGNGTAAIAAFWAGLQYDALCSKAEHATWLERILNCAVLAHLASGEVKDDSLSKEFLADIRHSFASSLLAEPCDQDAEDEMEDHDPSEEDEDF